MTPPFDEEGLDPEQIEYVHRLERELRELRSASRVVYNYHEDEFGCTDVMKNLRLALYPPSAAVHEVELKRSTSRVFDALNHELKLLGGVCLPPHRGPVINALVRAILSETKGLL